MSEIITVFFAFIVWKYKTFSRSMTPIIANVKLGVG